MDVGFFRTHALTKGLTGAELERFNNVVTKMPVKAGERLCVEGASAPGLFLIRDGSVKVTKKSGKSERTLAELQGPTVLGELELLSGRPCFATVVALSDAEAYLLSVEAFERLVNAGDAVASKISRNIGRVVIDRLAETNVKLVSLMND
ncbi:MAG: cyclic nucleotide-binding domain-containing protein [Deltaproteobacteria bacterium]|nr:cyclic nucleotide-binding domain-containing protein [Deltaproteobacteria bacterium]